ncbi:unnamed protein product [Rotaria socialis]
MYLSMQHCTRHRTLYFRLLISLFLSTNAYLFLFPITNEYRPFHLSFKKTNSVADRIVLLVRTSHNCESRLNYLLQSWISTDVLEQSNLYLITDRLSNSANLTLFSSFQNVIQTGCPETHDRNDLCCKTAHEFNLFYNLILTKPNLEWLCRFDDDHYVNIKNLYKYLSQINASKSYYMGRTSISGRLRASNSIRSYSFATYGAGVCFSHALLKQLRPHVHIKNLPVDCLKHRLSDDAYIGYLIECILNVSLTARNDLFHSHLEKLETSFRYFNLNHLSDSITFGFAWDRYKLDWLPIIHELIQLTNRGQIKTASRLWLFLRNYEKEHPENLKDKYDESCISHQRLRNQSIEVHTSKTRKSIETLKQHNETG